MNLLDAGMTRQLMRDSTCDEEIRPTRLGVLSESRDTATDAAREIIIHRAMYCVMALAARVLKRMTEPQLRQETSSLLARQTWGRE